MAQWFSRQGSNLATVARSTGYPVVEVPGWAGLGHGGMADYVGVVTMHHTAGPEPERTRSNYPSLNVVRNGRPGLEGPLAHYGIGFDGTVYVIAAGCAWHAGSGGWAGYSGNSRTIGIEAEDSGDGDWTRAQLDCYPRLVAAICRFLGIASGRVCAHREWAPRRKIDPSGIDMNQFRATVARYLRNPHTIHKGRSGSAASVAPATDLTLLGDEDVFLPRSRPGKHHSITMEVPARDVQLVLGIGWTSFTVHSVKFLGSPPAKGVNYLRTLKGQRIDAGRPMRVVNIPGGAVCVEITYTHTHPDHEAFAGWRRRYATS